jgi:RNA polymerase sigma-70 factor (ECF subfamily)
MDNSEVLERIKEGDKSVLEHVYVKYRLDFIEWLTSTYNINVHDAKELYQQTILIFYENIVNGRLNEMSSNIRTYLFAIGKNKYSELTRYWNKNINTPNFKIPDNSFLSEGNEQNNDLINLSEKLLMQMGSPCKELLELYYYHKKTMSEIAKILGYKDEHSTKNKKYRCLGQLRELVQEELRKN